jgi:hypothetical protein
MCGSAEAGKERKAINDNFNDRTLDLNRWFMTIGPENAGSIIEVNQQLEMSKTVSGYGYLGLSTVCQVSGDFDVRVDFRLLTWPAQNFHSIRLVARDLPQGDIGLVGVYRNSYNDELYQFRTADGLTGEVFRADFAGRLRLQRTGSTIEASYWDGVEFVLLGSAPTTDAATAFVIDFASPEPTAPASVTVAFDNFRIKAGTPVCPDIAIPSP